MVALSNRVTKAKVSIICLSYNHSLYIRQAIDSLLEQKTKFLYEIIVHDDASTDGTIEILQDYKSKHSELIHLIIQQENQYSKVGFSQILKTAIDASSGDYIAICEGDDYWLDNNKLQLQIEMMEKTSAGMSFHPVAELQNDVLKLPDLRLYEDRVYSVSELIRKDFHFVQTSSIVFSRKSLGNLSYDIMSRSPVADVIIRLAAAVDSGAICIPLIGSVYRVLSEGSWTSSMKSMEKFLVYIRAMLATIRELDSFYHYRFSSDFEYYKYMFVRAVIQNSDVSLMLRLNFTNELSSKYKIFSYLIILARAPRIHLFFKKSIRSMRNFFSG